MGADLLSEHAGRTLEREAAPRADWDSGTFNRDYRQRG